MQEVSWDQLRLYVYTDSSIKLTYDLRFKIYLFPLSLYMYIDTSW